MILVKMYCEWQNQMNPPIVTKSTFIFCQLHVIMLVECRSFHIKCETNTNACNAQWKDKAGKTRHLKIEEKGSIFLIFKSNELSSLNTSCYKKNLALGSILKILDRSPQVFHRPSQCSVIWMAQYHPIYQERWLPRFLTFMASIVSSYIPWYENVYENLNWFCTSQYFYLFKILSRNRPF